MESLCLAALLGLYVTNKVRLKVSFSYEVHYICVSVCVEREIWMYELWIGEVWKWDEICLRVLYFLLLQR